MPKIFTSETQKIGEIAETKAVEFLMKQGFEIIDRNYTRKWGELDIVAIKDTRLHFIEVKSTTAKINTSTEDNYRPEDNMHPWKLKRLSRVIQTFLLSNKKFDNWDWQLDLILVYLNSNREVVDIKLEKDIIL